MTTTLGIVADPISTLNIKKDSTIAMIQEAWNIGWSVKVFTDKSIYALGDKAFAHSHTIAPDNTGISWYSISDTNPSDHLGEMDCILMRKDPPFDVNYIYTTYMLDLAQGKGAYISNNPASLRDCNEKFFITQFSDWTPPTLVASNKDIIRTFVQDIGKAVIKPLHGMGGELIFTTFATDENFSVIYEAVSLNGTRPVMVQKYIPEISEGDRRIICINGVPCEYALARIPADNELRGNLAAGATGQAQPLTSRERQLCDAIGPELQKRGLDFVGLDIIGGFLTEVNVTSPTGIREIFDQTNTAVATNYLNFLESKI